MERYPEWTPAAQRTLNQATAAFWNARLSSLSQQEQKALPEGDLWSFIRRVMVQGGSQQQDYAAGKYADYEELSARMDAAARERLPELLALLSGQPVVSSPPKGLKEEPSEEAVKAALAVGGSEGSTPCHST